MTAVIVRLAVKVAVSAWLPAGWPAGSAWTRAASLSGPYSPQEISAAAMPSTRFPTVPSWKASFVPLRGNWMLKPFPLLSSALTKPPNAPAAAMTPAISHAGLGFYGFGGVGVLATSR